MYNEEELERIEKAKNEWEQGLLKRQLERFGMEKPPSKTFTPLDLRDWDFQEKVGSPGQYPFTSLEYPTHLPDVPCGPVNTLDTALANPQVLATDMVVSIDHTLGGQIKQTGNPIKMSTTPPESRNKFLSPPVVGEHTEEILNAAFGLLQGKDRTVTAGEDDLISAARIPLSQLTKAVGS